MRKILGVPTLLWLMLVYFVVTVAGLVNYQMSITTTGVYASAEIQVYNDAACTSICTSISWGSMGKGSSVSITKYIKDIGTVPVTLTFNRTNFNPSTFSASIFSTNYDNTPIAVGAVRPVIFTLSIPSTYTQTGNTFSFDLLIPSTEVPAG